MRIRQYREADRDQVWSLHNLALEGTGAHAGKGPWDEDLQHIREAYLEEGGEFLIGTHNGRIVAMGALKRSSSARAEIKRMRVHPDCQRRGFGKAILQELEGRAVDLGYRVLHLDTTVQQAAAQELYLKHGFSEVGRARAAGFEVIHYEKALKPT